MILLLLAIIFISGCSACPCNQAQLDAVTQTVIDMQMNRTVGTVVAQ